MNSHITCRTARNNPPARKISIAVILMGMLLFQTLSSFALNIEQIQQQDENHLQAAQEEAILSVPEKQSFSKEPARTAERPVHSDILQLEMLPLQMVDAESFSDSAAELLVRFQPGAARNIAAMNAVHQHVGASVKRDYHLVKGLQLVQLKQGLSAAEGLQRYKNNPNVLYAEPVYQLHALGIPNDPDFSALWGLHNTGQTIQSQTGTTGADISAVQAWQLETGSSDIIVAVVDTGVDYTHPDLTGNMWISGEGYYGKNFIAEASDPNNPMDDNGHGTHVAGTIAAVGNNLTGITGVMQEARIMALKVLDGSGSGNTALLIDAIQYADDNQADVINISLGGENESQAVYDALAASRAVIVAAAGNKGINNDSAPFYPAGYDLPHLIAVAATDHRDQLADFSNYGAASVHVAAPGQFIFSTIPGNGYDYKSGTSMAAPHVSGLAGLVLSARSDLTPEEVISQIKNNVDILNSLAGKVSSGGRINAFSTLLDGFLESLEWENWVQPLTGTPAKVWTIKFSQAVDPALLNQQIFVTHADTYTPVDGVMFQVNPENSSEILLSKPDGWLPGQYHLHISSQVSSVEGEPLAQGILALFEIH